METTATNKRSTFILLALAAAVLLMLACSGVKPQTKSPPVTDGEAAKNGKDDSRPSGSELGPLKPFTHDGNPQTDEENAVAVRVICQATGGTQVRRVVKVEGVSYYEPARWSDPIEGGYRMLREVEFLAWGPHDLKGETVNLRTSDNKILCRVRYRYQRVDSPLVEKDEFVKLKWCDGPSGSELEEAKLTVTVTRLNGDFGPHEPLTRRGYRIEEILVNNNPDGGLWLERALQSKRKREGR